MKRLWWMMAIAFVLFLIHAHADYLLQAYQHGWWTWWDLHGRAAEWPWYLDILPRDDWHLVQSVRNHTVIFATLFTVMSISGVSFRSSETGTWLRMQVALPVANKLARNDPMAVFGIYDVVMTAAWFLHQLIIAELLYGISRAIAFSIPKALWS